MKDSIAQYMSKKCTATYYAQLRSKDINNICFMYLGSKAFRDKTRTFLVNRWSEMTDDKIIDDLLLVNKGDVYQYPFNETKKYTSFYWICTYDCIDILSMDVIRKLPTTVWNEQILDTHGSNDMTKFEVNTTRECLLTKRKTPQEIKDYLKQ